MGGCRGDNDEQGLDPRGIGGAGRMNNYILEVMSKTGTFARLELNNTTGTLWNNWQCINIDGLDPSFMSLDTEETIDSPGRLYTQQAAEVRPIAITLACREAKFENILHNCQQTFVSGAYCKLYPENDNYLWLPCRVINYELNRFSNSIQLTLNLQPMTRYWHTSDSSDQTTANKFYVYSDVPTRPYIRVGCSVPADTTSILITHCYYKMTMDNEAGDGGLKTTELKRLRYTLPETITSGTYINFVFDSTKRQAYIITNKTASTKRIIYPDQRDDLWDGLLHPGYNELYIYVNDTTLVASTIDKNSQYICARQHGWDDTDGLLYSDKLTPENVRKNAEVLGVVGTAGEAVSNYNGEYEIKPSKSQQTLATKDLFLRKDIKVKALSPVLDEDDIDIAFMTKNYKPSESYTSRDLNTLDDYCLVHVKAREGLYPAGVVSSKPVIVGFNSITRANCIPANIRSGVTILGVTGEYKTMSFVPATKGADIVKLATNFIKDLDLTDVKDKLNTLTDTGAIFKNSQVANVESITFPASGAITDAADTFNGLSNLKYVDISGWTNASNITVTTDMFAGCTSLTTVYWPSGFLSPSYSGKFDLADCPLDAASVSRLADALTINNIDLAGSVVLAASVWTAATAAYPDVGARFSAKKWLVVV